MNTHTQSGFSMIEVLVTMVILAIGLLGVAGLQIASVRNTHVAAQRSIATQQASDIVERMRANMGPFIGGVPVPGEGTAGGAYDNLGANIPAAPACAPGCTPAQQAVVDHADWNTANAALLPNGNGTVVGSLANGFIVTINWTEAAEAAPVARSFVTEVHP
jgi:type IV pilus assembly protein PilV